MKKILFITTFMAATLSLWAETNQTVAIASTNSTADLQMVDIDGQAKLIHQIAAKAAAGFDAEDYAQSLQARILALVQNQASAPPSATNRPAATVVMSVTESKMPVEHVGGPGANITDAGASAVTPEPNTLQQVIKTLRSEANRLEDMLKKPSSNP